MPEILSPLELQAICDNDYMTASRVSPETGLEIEQSWSLTDDAQKIIEIRSLRYRLENGGVQPSHSLFIRVYNSQTGQQDGQECLYVKPDMLDTFPKDHVSNRVISGSADVTPFVPFGAVGYSKLFMDGIEYDKQPGIDYDFATSCFIDTHLAQKRAKQKQQPAHINTFTTFIDASPLELVKRFFSGGKNKNTPE